ncbi:MAG: NAD(P)H-binding protein [Deltaproteobacteria bacterium]|nr:NAD(P)H-binding protein [Deltaproteobacteria bacterium]
MTGKTAVMIGATGLVGSQVLEQLLGDERFSQVRSFGRRKTGRTHPKLDERVVDFENPAAWQADVKGDVAFSCLGTTIKQAGSKEVQRKIDYSYQLHFAEAAKANGVRVYSLCSAASANARSPAFYSRIKGELDRDVGALGFERTRIFRPSLLLGDRGDRERLGEKLATPVLRGLNAIGLFRKSRAIEASTVARAMIRATFDEAPGTKIYTLDEVFTAAGE